MSALPPPPPPSLVDPCWNRIGIGGDHSCPELAAHIHCRSCPVFSAAARAFFDRPAPEGYVAEWTRLLGVRKEEVERDARSVLLFRLEAEWLAIATRAVSEVTALPPVHRVPHRTNETLAGLVNVRGQLLVCVSLRGVLGIEPGGRGPSANVGSCGARLVQPRLVVIGSKSERWAFPADEVPGVRQVAPSALRPVSTTFARAAAGLSRAVFSSGDCTVGLLDDRRVFEALRSLGP